MKMPETENKSKKRGFFSNMMAELKKVIWPSPAQTAKSTSATIAFVLLISIILIVLNLFFEAINNFWWGLWN